LKIKVNKLIGLSESLLYFYGQGGMKAVVWADTVQIFLISASILALVIKGVIDIGIENVWQLNLNSSRIEFFK